MLVLLPPVTTCCGGMLIVGGIAGVGGLALQFTVIEAVPCAVPTLAWMFAVPDAWLLGAVKTASTPPPRVVAVVGLSEPMAVLSETLVPSATYPPTALRTVTVTKAVPLQPTLVGEAATVTVEAKLMVVGVGSASPVPQITGCE